MMMNDPSAQEKKTASAEDDAAVSDPLLDSLVFLTAHYGHAKSAEAIRAGLAYDEHGMGPELFCEAADRLSLKAKIVHQKDIRKISEAVLPAVLTLEKSSACVLLSFKGADKKKAVIWIPESQTTKDVSLDKLTKSYAGYAIYTHPRAEFSDPEAPHAKDIDRHWFWGAVTDNMPLYSKVLVAAVLINFFGLTSPLFVMNVYDRVIPNSAIETGWVIGIGALTVFLFDFIMRTLRGYFVDLAGKRIDVVVSRKIFDQLMNIKMACRPPSSGVFANMLREFESVRDFMTSATMTALVDLPFTFLFIFFIYLIGGPIAFLLFFLLALVIITGLVVQIPLRSAVRKSLHGAEAKHGLLVESIQGLETIKAIGADGRMRARYGVHVGEGANSSQRSRFYSALGVNMASFIQQSATIVIVLLGMYMVRDTNLSMGGLIACVILGGRAIAPIGQVANLMARYHQAMSALKTLNEIMAMPVERPAQARFLHRPELSGSVTFDKVSFAYPQTDRKVLDGVTFKIHPGEKVGLIGRIGSGKSTVARLMLGLYDPLDGTLMASDTDYRQIDPADLRRNIAYIAQDVVLFRGSVRENIIVSRPNATEEQILAVSKAAGVHEFISRHPMGYDAPVGEHGEGLSGGQRQAIALARAMLLEPAILVCDEPTNAMDIQAEESFARYIREYSRDKTMVLITHRQHLLGLVDRLILLDMGRVVLDGERDKVLQALSQGKVEVPKGKA